MSLSRRRALGLMGGAAIAIPFASACDSGGDGGGGGDPGAGKVLGNKAPLPAPFTQPLRVPPVLKPVRRDGNTDYYEVTAKATTATILPGLSTQIWGYEGSFPGPTIEARSGRRVVVRTTNELPIPITTHLHGGRNPPQEDGYPTDLILPKGGWTGAPAPSVHHGGVGATHHGTTYDGVKEYVYPLEQRAATLWYHDHRMDFTGPQVWRGLAGFHLLRDDEEDALPLPRGDRELPLMILDRSFDENGQFSYPSVDPNLRQPGVTGSFPDGVEGEVILVNGVPWPFKEVEAARYRLRILNASNARRYRLTLDPQPEGSAPFRLIGSDQGLLDRPRDMNSIYMTPAERFDVIVDFSGYQPGTTVVLGNRLASGRQAQIMQFRVTGKAADDSAVPDRLSTIERLDPARAVRTRRFAFERGERNDQIVHLINNQLFSTDAIMADPKLGSTEIWEFRSSSHHPIHVHLVPFQLVERGGGLNPEDVGWKDTVRLTPNQPVKALIRFDGYPGKYVFHCHNLEHEDMAMMANFQVT